MTIDAHQHFWKYDPVRDTWIDNTMRKIQRDFLPGDLEPLLTENEVHGCITVQADQSEEETRFLLAQTQELEAIRGVVGWVDLLQDSVDERLQDFVHHPKLKGIRHIVQSEPADFVLREDFQRGISRLGTHGLVYDILIYPDQLVNTISFVENFPEQVFVLDHLAKPRIKDGLMDGWDKWIKELAAHPNVYCKVSGMVTEASWDTWEYADFLPYLDTVFEAFGTSRTLFGSDWPVCLLAASYASVLQIVKRYLMQFTAEERAAVLGGNAIRAYALDC